MFLLSLLPLLSSPPVRAEQPGSTSIAAWRGDARCALSLTFDDNHPSRGEAAAILDGFGFTGTFFVIVGSVDARMERIYEDLAMRGHELGSHSLSHAHLLQASSEQVEYELGLSKARLEEMTGLACVSFASPYGEVNAVILETAARHYLSARGTTGGTNADGTFDMYNLGINIFPPGIGPYSEADYLSVLRQYVEYVDSVGGWGTEMFHNIGPENNLITVTAHTLSTHCEELASGALSDSIWVAPQGRAARYYLERMNTEAETDLVTSDTIVVRLNFDGDRRVFDEPLTVKTVIAVDWPQAAPEVFQDGKEYSCRLDMAGADRVAVYEALPGRGPVTIRRP